MSKKKITIIIPTYNRILKNNKSIKNFYFFTKKDLNIFIIEDGSSNEIINNNIQFLKKFSKIKYFFYKKNKGQSYACNLGIKNAKTDYVWFFDDDDLVTSKTIKDVLNEIKLNYKDGYLLPMQQIYKNKILKEINPSIRRHDFNDLRNNGQLVSTSCSLFKLYLIRKIGGWDNNLFGGTDTDLFLRFSKVGKFSFINTTPIKINLSFSNRLTTMIMRQQRAKIFFLIKHWNSLTFKRKCYYLITLIFFFPALYKMKYKLNLFLSNLRKVIF